MFLNLCEKALYLVRCVGMFITNCIDSETTSPVESQNFIVHKKLGIASIPDTHKGVKLMSQN